MLLNLIEERRKFSVCSVANFLADSKFCMATDAVDMDAKILAFSWDQELR